VVVVNLGYPWIFGDLWGPLKRFHPCGVRPPCSGCRAKSPRDVALWKFVCLSTFWLAWHGVRRVSSKAKDMTIRWQNLLGFAIVTISSLTRNMLAGKQECTMKNAGHEQLIIILSQLPHKIT